MRKFRSLFVIPVRTKLLIKLKVVRARFRKL